ncbi:uncharacterized protein LOC118159777 [Oxyura jamaicensis]|uniref:uncharacterized protein LOC118159777 n=1 Tax=Oxyura jamaicensis TaxID=8884 RepID=UPI0015A5129B|nr:uncharacterized protein LOC118159777 [Oxyura jamaicensis]
MKRLRFGTFLSFLPTRCKAGWVEGTTRCNGARTALAWGAHAGRATRAWVARCRDVARRLRLSPKRGDATSLLGHSGRCSCILGAACACCTPVVHLAILCVAPVVPLTRRLCMPPVSPAANVCVTRRLHAYPGSAGLCHRHHGCTRSRLISGDGFRAPALPCPRVWWRGRCLVRRGGLITLRKVIKAAGLQLGGSAAILGFPPSPLLGGTRARPGPWRPNRARSPASAPPERARPWRPRQRLLSLPRGGSKARLLIGRLRSALSLSTNRRAPFASSPVPPPWSRPRAAAAAGVGPISAERGNFKPTPRALSQWETLRPAGSQSGSQRGYKRRGLCGGTCRRRRRCEEICGLTAAPSGRL